MGIFGRGIRGLLRRKRRPSWLGELIEQPSEEEMGEDHSSTSVSAMQVWQEAMDLVVHCSRLIRDFPGSERYDLAYKMRQCAHEIPSAVARAMRFNDSLYFLYHMNSAYSRLLWLDTDLELAESLDYVTREESMLFREHSIGVRTMIRKLIEETREVTRESGLLTGPQV